MLRNIYATPLFMNFSKSSLAYARQLCSKPLSVEDPFNTTSCTTNSNEHLRQKMNDMQQKQRWLPCNKGSIYRVPTKLRKIDPKAYEPHFISIGPYHHGLPQFQDSEKHKWQSMNRLSGFDDNRKLSDEIKAIEVEAREFYSDEVKYNTDKFVDIMLLDGCFIVDLFRELSQNNFSSSNLSLLCKRWMLPVVRRDLITLENQLPMIVLKKIFDATRMTTTNSMDDMSLEELALRFFDPLMPREEVVLQRSIASINGNNSREFEHLLDIFHSSITLGGKVKRSKEPHMHRSVTELKEAGIKVRVLDNAQPLELRFERGVLMMPSLLIDNHTTSFFRNIVAYEQCRQECKPDMTTYLFFLDKLINSAEDVGLLHYERIIQHTLGSNKQVAKLVNNLCIEVEHDGQESYLYEVVERLDFYSNRWFFMVKARLKHDYFGNLWVGISTLAALFLIYLTLLQTSCEVVGPREKEKKGWWVRVNTFLVHPIEGITEMGGSVLSFLAKAYNNNDDDPSSCTFTKP